MQVDVRIDGFRARVVLDLYYYNDQPRQLEGNFQLRLPEEASPYFFAFGRTVYQARQVQAADSMFFKRDAGVLGRHDARADSGPAPRELGGAEGRPDGAEGEGGLRLSRDGPPAGRSGVGRVVGGGRVPVPRLPLGPAIAAPRDHRLRRGPFASRRRPGVAARSARKDAGLRGRFQHRRRFGTSRSASTPRRRNRPTASGFPIGWSIRRTARSWCGCASRARRCSSAATARRGATLPCGRRASPDP